MIQLRIDLSKCRHILSEHHILFRQTLSPLQLRSHLVQFSDHLVDLAIREFLQPQRKLPLTHVTNESANLSNRRCQFIDHSINCEAGKPSAQNCKNKCDLKEIVRLMHNFFIGNIRGSQADHASIRRTNRRKARKPVTLLIMDIVKGRGLQTDQHFRLICVNRLIWGSWRRPIFTVVRIRIDRVFQLRCRPFARRSQEINEANGFVPKLIFRRHEANQLFEAHILRRVDVVRCSNNCDHLGIDTSRNGSCESLNSRLQTLEEDFSRAQKTNQANSNSRNDCDQNCCKFYFCEQPHSRFA